mmetsp:Transcript_12133/g.28424  ORF Transcript_12133/g.28424 Transcript_12133/m.28424 type:complete len:375 (+) Transcript_12133:2241-3365(+)
MDLQLFGGDVLVPVPAPLPEARLILHLRPAEASRQFLELLDGLFPLHDFLEGVGEFLHLGVLGLPRHLLQQTLRRPQVVLGRLRRVEHRVGVRGESDGELLPRIGRRLELPLEKYDGFHEAHVPDGLIGDLHHERAELDLLARLRGQRVALSVTRESVHHEELGDHFRLFDGDAEGRQTVKFHVHQPLSLARAEFHEGASHFVGRFGGLGLELGHPLRLLLLPPLKHQPQNTIPRAPPFVGGLGVGLGRRGLAGLVALPAPVSDQRVLRELLGPHQLQLLLQHGPWLAADQSDGKCVQHPHGFAECEFTIGIGRRLDLNLDLLKDIRDCDLRARAAGVTHGCQMSHLIAMCSVIYIRYFFCIFSPSFQARWFPS